MRFAIEALGLRAGGGKELGLNLLSRLRQFPDDDFLLFLPDLPEYRSLAGANVRCIHAGSRNLASRYWTLQRVIPRICAQYQTDALLCLGNFVPYRSPCPIAVLIQNACLAYREPVAERQLTLREKLILAYGRTALRALRNSSHVVVQTTTMREHLLSLQPLDPERISVIPNPLDSSAASGLTAPVRTLNKTRPFTFLCLARYYAHKNLEILPEALKRLLAYTSRQARCLITISAGQHPRARKLLDRIEREGLRHMLSNIGPVPNSRLACAFRSADALIFPTLLESYTRTYSEAMRFGLPILTSDRDFARHLCGEAAIYFDPLDPDSVARSMVSIMTDRNLRQRLINNGQRILSDLPTWDAIAAQFIVVLERAAQSMPSRSELLPEARL